MVVQGGDQKISVRLFDSGGTKLAERVVEGSGTVEFSAPYSDRFRFDVYNSFWSTTKTVQVHTSTCQW